MRAATSFLFLATLFCCTFEKVHWSLAGAVNLSDVLAICFLASYLILSRPRVPRTTGIVLAFFAAFLVVYLTGFYNLETAAALAQFAKGFVKFVIHFAFLAAAIAWLYRRDRSYYWRALTWFSAGLAVNALYGVVQLLVAQLGGNLDSALISPLTGGASQINIYGAVEGASVYRPNALTGDPNHLGIMLIVPLLVLTPLYLRLEPHHRLRRRLALLIAFLLVMELATLSRSGLLGLGVGAIILALPYSYYLGSRALLYPLAGVGAALAAVVVTRLHFFEVVIRSRFHTGGGSQSVHVQVYSFIPTILQSHPLFGLGLNNFSIYYELVTGKTNWGPHSFYVSLIVETGLVGTVLFGVFLLWVFMRLQAARALGRALADAGDPLAARVRPLAWGMTAALAGTMVSNVFYLTMQFYYFYAFLALALAIPLVFRPSPR
jgi:O-antigen ligase